MGSHKLHSFVNRALLGHSYEFVNAWMDQPYAYLGYQHRKVRHSLPELIQKYGTDDPMPILAGLIHILTDRGTGWGTDQRAHWTLEVIAAVEEEKLRATRQNRKPNVWKAAEEPLARLFLEVMKAQQRRKKLR